jgi:hypothetical protein
MARLFAEALVQLRGCDGDPPSRVLADRCLRYLSEPPGADWNGIYVAEQK